MFLATPARKMSFKMYFAQRNYNTLHLMIPKLIAPLYPLPLPLILLVEALHKPLPLKKSSLNMKIMYLFWLALLDLFIKLVDVLSPV